VYKLLLTCSCVIPSIPPSFSFILLLQAKVSILRDHCIIVYPNFKMTSLAPVIDIAGYLAGDKSQIPQIISEIDRAFRTTGFFQLVGHGISQAEIDGMIKKTAEFFALPDETKRKILGKQRGYQSPELRESLSSLAKEGFFMGRHMPGRNRPIVEGNLWLKEEVIPGFRQTMEKYFADMENLAVILLRLIALGLGLEETYFDDFAKQPEGMFAYLTLSFNNLVNMAHIYLQNQVLY
jgi:isopenicillin N synthase-like dioxygenase